MEGEGPAWISRMTSLLSAERNRMKVKDAHKLVDILNRHLINNDNSVANAIQIRKLCNDLTAEFPDLYFYTVSDRNPTIKVQ